MDADINGAILGDMVEGHGPGERHKRGDDRKGQVATDNLTRTGKETSNENEEVTGADEDI